MPNNFEKIAWPPKIHDVPAPVDAVLPTHPHQSTAPVGSSRFVD